MRITPKGCLGVGCLTPIVLIVLLILADTFLPSGAVRQLPSSAQFIQEYYWDDGFKGDFIRVVKARLPKEDFEQYAKNLGLTQKYNPAIHENDHVTMLTGGKPSWFDMPNGMDNCYFQYEPENDFLLRIKWEDGYVYFEAQSW